MTEIDRALAIMDAVRGRLTAYKVGLEEGERQTVEKIVAWLKAFDAPDDFYSLSFARSIEAGEWK